MIPTTIKMTPSPPIANSSPVLGPALFVLLPVPVACVGVAVGAVVGVAVGVGDGVGVGEGVGEGVGVGEGEREGDGERIGDGEPMIGERICLFSC